MNAVVLFAHDLAHGLDDIAIPGDLGEKTAVARDFGDDPVEIAVVLPIGVETTRFPELREDGEEPVEGSLGDAAGGESGGFHLEQGSHRVDLAKFVRTEGQEDGPAIPAEFHEPEPLQFEEGFAHRGSADPEARHRLGLGEAGPALPFAFEETGEKAAHDEAFAPRAFRAVLGAMGLAEGGHDQEGGGPIEVTIPNGISSWNSGRNLNFSGRFRRPSIRGPGRAIPGK